MLLADRVQFDPARKTHSVENVRNQAVVPLFPAAIVLQALVKVWMDDGYEGTLDCRVVRPDGQCLYILAMPHISNKRGESFVPGMDFGATVRFPVTMSGNYTLQIMEGEACVAEYPLHVRLEGEAG